VGLDKKLDTHREAVAKLQQQFQQAQPKKWEYVVFIFFFFWSSSFCHFWKLQGTLVFNNFISENKLYLLIKF
jgi:hypothetical protein